MHRLTNLGFSSVIIGRSSIYVLRKLHWLAKTYSACVYVKKIKDQPTYDFDQTLPELSRDEIKLLDTRFSFMFLDFKLTRTMFHM